ncbi:MAG: hypothetical protein OEY10_03795, partial [Nitrosopumilus sp.]|nr:hypothetical protein [Nitrosopumilus sp.]
MDTITPFIFVFYSFFALAQFIGGFIYGLFIISRVMKGSRNLGLLEMGWFTFGISSIILLFSFSSESQVLSILASLLSFIAFFLLYLHYESRIRSSHNVPALLLLIIFFIISFIMRFFGDGLGLKDNQIRFYREAFSFIFIIYVSLYAYNVTKKTITISNNRGLLLENRALLLMAIGRFLFLIWEITLVINNNNIPEHSFSEYLSEISFYSGAIIVGISVLLFFYILISMPEYTYKIPIPILTFMLFNSSGITVYSKKVKVQGYNIEFEDQLFSGALTA